MSEENPDLGKQFNKDLITVKEELEKYENPYILSYLVIVSIVNDKGGVVHVTGAQTVETESLLGRIELAKHTILEGHNKRYVLEEFKDKNIKPEVKNLLEQFIVRGKDKPN